MDELCKKHPELNENEMEIYEMTREQLFEYNWKRIHRLMQLRPDIFTENEGFQSYKWSFIFNSCVSPIHMHQTQFQMCVDTLASASQKQAWL